MRAWRIFRERFRDSAFTGIGGLYAASRWNHLGVAMVYTATSRALAALEFFVNIEPNDAPDDLLIAEASVPDSLIEVLDLASLPPDWRELENEACRNLGSNWAASNRSLALQAPSAVVPDEWNILLNPRHPEFSRVQVVATKPFRYDERMFRIRGSREPNR
jgi:RES domain-containing protein